MSDENNVKKVVIAAAGIGLLLFGSWFFVWGGRPPQIGSDKESLRVVEALYTAVSSHDTKRLSNCEEQLHKLRDEGKLPAPTADYLDGLISTARGGNWKGATHKMFDFMRGQRPAAATAS
jgi:hypothetical protein